MNLTNDEKRITDYFDTAFKNYGCTPKGVDWNSPEAQNIRFEQLTKVIDPPHEFSILDYGCGYGALIQYLYDNNFAFSKYIGYDISELILDEAKSVYAGQDSISFTTNLADILTVDYIVASGVYNIKLQTSYKKWTRHVISCLDKINTISKKGFAINFLTKYSDKEKMRQDLYYADPCFLFDYSKRNYAKNVAILHDYGVYDFTLIVRKDI